MTRAICPRTSKRKLIKSSQENIPDNCKENWPHIITSQSKLVNKGASDKKLTKTRLNVLSSKENIILGSNQQNISSFQSNECGPRKSERHRKSPFNNKDYVYNTPNGTVKTDTSAKSNGVSNTTNSHLTGGTKTSKQSKCPNRTLKKCSNLNKIVNTSQLNESYTAKDNSKSHIPVYRTIESSTTSDGTYNLSKEKKEAVYEFDEVDENEEPTKKRKKKKRATVRKPKIGPKALTINNIKYSSTESLVSLPEKTVRQKKTKPKMVVPRTKPYSSVNNLNDSEDTCYSVQSFMSHPSSVLLCKKRELDNKQELSVLQETQSENYQSPVNRRSNHSNNAENLPEIMVSSNDLHVNPINISTVFPNDFHTSQNNSAAPQQRCYPSKRSHSQNNTLGLSQCGSINDTVPNQFSHCSSNISASHDFLSSTPCKGSPLIVRCNSVFSESHDTDIPIRLRPSTGFIKDSSENMVTDNKYFGFDEPEELEEPLLSPIKNINLQEPGTLHRRHCVLSLDDFEENPKPNLKEVIEKLKATIPKPQIKKSSEVFNSDSSSTNSSITTSPISKEVETTLNFIKPPRRSYERQRRIRHYSEHEEEEDHENNDYNHQRKKNDEKRENVLKPTKKCYQKKNVTKVFKAPHVPKAKQRILKEEEELERLAAQMNAQFQEIEKCDLVVE